MHLLSDLLTDELARREASHLLRRRRTLVPIDAVHVLCDGRRLVNFASNDYLGLTHHPAVLGAMRAAIDRYGAGSGASALITGYTEEHEAAEIEVAKWKQSESAIVLPSGYQAAHAAVQTLAHVGKSGGSRGARFLIDKLAHASLIDAVRASNAEFRVFGHNQMDKLSRLLSDAPPDQLQIVVTESIFSMDGDAADLHSIASLKREHSFVLLLDEAHGSGVYGENGAGYAAEQGLAGMADVSIVTFSKAMGLMGGAICASRAFCEAVTNFGRAYIYSTAVAPALAAGVCAALKVMRDAPERQRRLRSEASSLRTKLGLAGLADSPIIPVILREPEAALAAAKSLEQAGMLVIAVRPPTVPPGTSRLRVTLSCEHGEDELTNLACILSAVKRSS